MWRTTFAFSPWHNAVEFKRYLHRFMQEFSEVETMTGVRRTVYNQYDSMIRPLEIWLELQGVNFKKGCTVTDLQTEINKNKEIVATGFEYLEAEKKHQISVEENDAVFFQNGSMTDAYSLGSMKKSPKLLTKKTSKGWELWGKLAKKHPEFGNPANFNSSIPETSWESFTVTLKDTAFFDEMEAFSGNKSGTGSQVTLKDSNWFLSFALNSQPHYRNQPSEVQVFWAYGLHPDRVGNFVAKPMTEFSTEFLIH